MADKRPTGHHHGDHVVLDALDALGGFDDHGDHNDNCGVITLMIYR